MKKLADADTTLANFFASGVLALGDRLGPLLWQLPPTMAFDADRLADFFTQLPRTLGAVAELAARHDHRITADRALVTTDRPDHPVRHALEVRHDSFRTPALPATCSASTTSPWSGPTTRASGRCWTRPPPTSATSGCTATPSCTPAATPTRRSMRGRRGSAGGPPTGQDVYVYCDNDAKVRAPYDAMGLMDRLGLAKPAP